MCRSREKRVWRKKENHQRGSFATYPAKIAFILPLHVWRSITAQKRGSFSRKDKMGGDFSRLSLFALTPRRAFQSSVLLICARREMEIRRRNTRGSDGTKRRHFQLKLSGEIRWRFEIVSGKSGERLGTVLGWCLDEYFARRFTETSL